MVLRAASVASLATLTHRGKWLHVIKHGTTRAQVAAHYVVSIHRWAAYIMWPLLLDVAAALQRAAQARLPPAVSTQQSDRDQPSGSEQTHVAAALALSHSLRISMNGCARHCIPASCESTWRTAMLRYINLWLASMTTGRSLPGGRNQQGTSGCRCWQRSWAGCVTPGARARILSAHACVL